MKKLIIFFLATILLFACRNEKKKIVEDKPKAIASDTLTYNYDSVVVYSKNVIKANGNASDTTKASVTFPVFKNEALNNAIRRRVTDYISEGEPTINYADMANSFVNGYDDYVKENKGTTEYWFLMVDIGVLYQNPNYIALQYMNSDFSGGAHPNTSLYFINYNPKTNHTLTLDSLIDNNKKPKLVSLAEKIFREDEKLTPTQPLEGKYFFADGKFVLPDNFYVNEKGLVFVYNQYEIKAYVYGTTEITIPFSLLKGIAKPNTILTTSN